MPNLAVSCAVNCAPGMAAVNVGGAVPTYQSILGSLILEMWDARVGVSAPSGVVASWTGVNGRVLTPPGTGPAYATDGSNFNGLPVIQTAITGTKCLNGAGFTGLPGAGTKPWTFSVFRWRIAATGLNSHLLSLGGGNVHGLSWRVADNSMRFEVNNTSNGDCPSIVPFDTNVHTAHAWVDSQVNLVVDGTAYSVAGSASISTPILEVGVGHLTTSIAGSQWSDTSHALHIICSAKPTAQQIADVKALSLSDWGV